MRKSVSFVLLLMLSVAAGCQTINYRWVKEGPGLPGECQRIYQFSDATIRYCIVEDMPIGYYLEGVLTFNEAGKRGRIGSGALNLMLLKDGEIVHRDIVIRDGAQFRFPIYLHAEIRYKGEFDEVHFYGNVYQSAM